MAEPISVQQLKDASLDVKSLEEVVNGDENVVVTTRLGETYPSVKGSISKLFENGGLPAEPFETLAKMNTDGAGLPDGQLAIVYNETANNGLYVKTEGAWVKALYDPLGQAKQYADNNPLFKPVLLLASDDLNTLPTGIYYSRVASYHDQIVNMPPITAPYNLGVVICYREGIVAYQKFLHYTTTEQWERVGNGSASNMIWQPWVKTVTNNDFVSLTNSVNSALTAKASINIFEHIELSASTAETYQATLDSSGTNKTLVMNTDAITLVSYKQKVDGRFIRVGDTVTFSSEIFGDGGGTNGGDISIQALSSTGSVLTTSPLARSTVINAWETITTNLIIPENTTHILIRFIRRLGNTVLKYRKPLLLSNNIYSTTVLPLSTNSGGTSVASVNTVYVSKSGLDTNSGAKTTPFLTIQKAITSLSNGGHVVVLDSADYRESVTITSSAHVKISAIAGNRVNLFGSDKLVVTKTSGMTKVYQAPLAAKPIGMGGNRGKPAIFEWGTPSKPIPDDERHALQRGLTHRLPFTEMNEVATKAELDSVNGKWFWESGVIYFTATDGSDARLKRYEARMRPVLTHSNGTIELVRVSSWFSNSYAMEFSGLATKRTSCMTYGAYHNGFADNANYTESYRDIGGANGNDGINLTVSPSTLGREETLNRVVGIYFDPYGHDNGDDGISCHYRSDCTIYGGLFEHNTKGDVIHVTGSNSTCYGTESRGTTNGFYTATNPDLDTVRVKTVMRCVGTKSTNNDYAYRAADNAELHLDDCVAITPTIMGYHQLGDDGVIRANNCKFDGDVLKTKTGNVVVKNTSLLAP